MRTYEALYIVQPDATEDDIQAITKEVEDLITTDGGVIVRSEVWGKRRLAYPVNKFTEGVYVLLRFEADAAFIVKLERYYQLSEVIIRDLVVHFDEQTLRLEAEQQRRTEALAEALTDSRTHSDSDDSDRRPAPVRPKPEPKAEAKPEPEVEAAATPAVEAIAEPVVEATATPEVEATAEPVVEAAAEPEAEADPKPEQSVEA